MIAIDEGTVLGVLLERELDLRVRVRRIRKGADVLNYSLSTPELFESAGQLIHAVVNVHENVLYVIERTLEVL